MPCYGDHFGSYWSILVHFGTHHGWPHHPSMTGSDSYPLSSAHFIQKRVILVTQENSKHFCTAMLYWPFGSNLSHFGPFWCTSWVTPPPPHDWFRLLSPFKCPFYPEMGHISDSGQIWNTFAMLTIWINFGSFLSTLVHLMGDPTTPPWLFPTLTPFQVSILSRNGSY